MWVIAILMFFSLIVAGGFLCAYIWAVKSGQYDDKYTPSVRILFEDKHKEGQASDVERRASPPKAE